MSKKRILLVAPFTLLPGEEGDNRFRYIAELLASQHDVTFVTSSFNHPKKTHRDKAESFGPLPYQLELLEEPGYQRNIGLKRILSHRTFVKNLKQVLATKNGQFDFVYAAFPMIGSAEVAGRFAQENKIPFYLDVQDIWPESILVYFGKMRSMANFFLAPLTKKANAVYQMADGVIAVSKTYVQRVMQVNTKATFQLPIYIGIDLAAFDFAAEKQQIEQSSDEIIGVYSGSFSHSYDVETVIRATALVAESGKPFRLEILGTGPHEESLKTLMKQLNAPVIFHGYKSFAEMANILKRAHIGFHAISSSSQSSMTNKFADYCAAGLVILNSSPSDEIRNLIEEHNLGKNYAAGDHKKLANHILNLINDENSLAKMGERSRLFAEKELDRQKTYAELLELFR